jgi:hypothetical protein
MSARLGRASMATGAPRILLGQAPRDCGSSVHHVYGMRLVYQLGNSVGNRHGGVSRRRWGDEPSDAWVCRSQTVCDHHLDLRRPAA